MGLQRAIGTFAVDRESEAMVRDVLRAFQDREGQWVSSETIIRLTNKPRTLVQSLLSALTAGFVLDCDGGSPASYRYRPDSILRREVEAFERRAESHSGMLQANVARFRQRYGAQ